LPWPNRPCRKTTRWEGLSVSVEASPTVVVWRLRVGAVTASTLRGLYPGAVTVAEVLQCDYFDAGRCRSCTLLGTPYGQQVRTKQRRCQDVLDPLAAGLQWQEPFASRPSGFRNKAKLVVGGTRAEPTVGILDRAGDG